MSAPSSSVGEAPAPQFLITPRVNAVALYYCLKPAASGGHQPWRSKLCSMLGSMFDNSPVVAEKDRCGTAKRFYNKVTEYKKANPTFNPLVIEPLL